MCVIVAKYFEDYGWTAVKNRDRNYTPEISFRRIKDSTGIERLLFEDDVTNYMEGINSDGVAILGASLMVQEDEKAITKSSKKVSPDGKRIREALKYGKPLEAAKIAIKIKLTGSNLFVNDDECYLLESSTNRNGEFKFKLGQIRKDQTVARSNHGIWLPWAGYQRGINSDQTMSRISSEARLAQAEFVVETARDPQELMDGLCKIYVGSSQLNVMRTDTKTKKMRTTAQLMAMPSERTLFCRPVSSSMTFDYWKLNRPGSDTWVEILSNRPLYVDNDFGPFGKINTKHKTD